MLDSVSSGGVTLGRAWSTGGRYASDAREQRAHIFYSVEGSARFTAQGREAVLEPGHALILGADTPILGVIDSAWVRYEWQLQPAVLAAPSMRAAWGQPFPVDHARLRPLLARTDALLAATTIGDLGRFGDLVEQAILDVQRGERLREEAPHRDRALIAAQTLIASRYADPGFTVRDLSAALQISTTHLHRVYTTIGTTPRLELERRRTGHARQLLGIALDARPSVDAIAEESGFRSRVHMQRTLRREEAR